MNISIIGASHSRNIFCTDVVDDFQEHFTVKSCYGATSVLSLMSNSINYNFDNLVKSDLTNNLIDYWYYELEKPFLKNLQSNKPNILLMDFYGDARYGVRSYGGEYIINRLIHLKKRDILEWNKFGIVYSYKNNEQDFITMWQNRFDRFMEFMYENLPETQIVINTTKGCNVVKDKDGKQYTPQSLQELELEEINQLWEEFDNYAITKYNLKQLTISENYTLDATMSPKLSPIDFEKDYYVSCFYELIKIKQQCEKLKNDESNVNLIIDSDYRKKLDKWTNVVGEFEFIEASGVTSISPIDCGSQSDKYRPQAWSRPMEINGDGETEYTLSFYIKFADMTNVESDMVVFAIRTFQHVKEIKYSEILEEYRLTLEGHEICEGKEYRYVCKIIPNGKFIRVAPFLLKYLPGVEYSRIKLERASEASEYTK